MQTDQIRPSLPKRNLDYLVLNEPNKVEIFRKFLNRKSGRELLKPFKGKIVRITGSTYISDKGKVIKRSHLAVRHKSTDLSFSGKQLTPVKKGQKRPIVSSSPSSSEDNRLLKQSSSRQRITAKTVKIPACSSKIPISANFIYSISWPNCVDLVKGNFSLGGSRCTDYPFSTTLYSSSRLNSIFFHVWKSRNGGSH